MKAFFLPLPRLVLFVGFCTIVHPALAGGVVSDCDEPSLRSALIGGGTVTFECDGTITLTSTIQVTNDTVLDATDHSVILSGNGSVQLLTVASNASLTLRNLTLADGLVRGVDGIPATPGQGGAVHVNGGMLVADGCTFLRSSAVGGDGEFGGFGQPGDGGNGSGGALYFNNGALRATNCIFQHNSATGGSSLRIGGDGEGGAIGARGGNLTLVGCLMQGNQANGGAGFFPSVMPRGGNGFGGGLFAIDGGFIEVLDSTIAGNHAIGGPPSSNPTGFSGPAAGGGVFNGSSLQLVNSTICENTALPNEVGLPTLGGYGAGIHNNSGSASLNHVTIANNAGTGVGGIFVISGSVTLANTILDGNFPVNVINDSGTLSDLGYNLSSDNSEGLSGTGSLTNAEPRLAPLGDYGGPTPTMALIEGSQAIDAANPSSIAPTDQRGRARPFGAAPDIGAFESSAPFIIAGSVTGWGLVNQVSVSAGQTNTSTTAGGRYSIGGLAAGTYAVAPSSTNHLFVPDSQNITVGPDRVGVEFRAYRWNTLVPEGITNNTLRLTFATTNGSTQFLECSTNLFDWLVVATNAVSSENYFEFVVPVEIDQPGYYRVAVPF